MTTIPDENEPAIEVYEDEVDEPGPAQSVPDSGEGGKIKTMMSILKKCLGVKDIASMYDLVLFEEKMSSCLTTPYNIYQAYFSSCFSTGTNPELGILELPGQARFVCGVSQISLFKRWTTIS